jgi:protein SCO1
VARGLPSADSPPALQGGFTATEVTGLDYGSGIELRDTRGALRSVDRFPGKVVVVFFGFASCPDVCPTTLTRLANIRRQLGPVGQDLQVVLVTVDPERDVAARLDAYLAPFDPTFLALRPEPAQLPAVLKSFRAVAEKFPMPGTDEYMMGHSTALYIYDRRGRLRLIGSINQPDQALLKDLSRLLRD